MSVVSNEQLRKIIVDSGLVAPADWDAALQNSERRDRDMVDVLIERNLVDARKIYDLVADYLNVPFIDLRKEKIDFEILKILPEATMAELKAVPFAREGKQILRVAFLRPQDTPSIDEIQKLTDLKVRPFLTSKKSFAYAARLYQRDLATELGHLIEDVSPKGRAGRGRKTSPPEFPVIKILDTIMTHAVMTGASDIHMEPLVDGYLVRFRVDGLLHDMLELPKLLSGPLVARVKIMSDLKIDEHRMPQDGRMEFFAEDENIYIRVSIIPTFYGEKIVMRVLNAQEQRLTLTDLGLGGNPLKIVENRLRSPHGMLLVVGPTGSGKTTTLYTLLGMMNTERVNISTIEDPIEYGLARVNQTQINPQVGYTFASGLRALLRQDPNIIMVGEIRDEETAEICVQAGLTGHLVLSTLHTNDAVGVIPRLVDMRIKPYVISSTVSLIISQRLMRKICKDCSEAYKMSVQEAEALERDLRAQHIVDGLKRLGLVDRKSRYLHEFTYYRGKGCNQCRHSGYVGRVGIYEVMEMTRELREAIIEGASSDELLDVARRNGMITLTEDAWSKVLGGTTTVEELLRVVKE